jgi:hypothetical protein
MRDEIVARVARALNAPLMAAEAQRAERSTEPASMDLYFQGMAGVNKGLRPEWLAQARRCFEEAKARRYLTIREQTIQALQATGVP